MANRVDELEEEDAFDLDDLKPSATTSSGAKSKSSGGLSELSKQLRALQAENYQKGNEIDRLERKLKIMADLKGVSVGDLKLALHQACEGEAFNELRSQVVTLRHQLALADQGKKNELNRRTFDKQATSNKLANLELRVGELEEVEENLQVQIAKLYKQLREQTAKATELEAKCEEQRNEILDLAQQANDTKAKDELVRRQAELKEAQAEIERLVGLLSKAQYELRRLREKIQILEEELGKMKALERRCAQMKAKMDELVATAAKEAKEMDERYQMEAQGVMSHMDMLSKRAVAAETQAKHANEKLKDCEKQLTRLRDVEVQFEQQKEYIKDFKANSSKELQQRDEASKTVLDSAKNEIRTMQNHIEKLKLDLHSEKESASELGQTLSLTQATVRDYERKLQRLRSLELECARHKEQIKEMREESSRSHQEKDEAHKAASHTVMQEMQSLRDRAIQAEIQLSNEEQRVTNLAQDLADSRQKLHGYEKKLSQLRALELECEEQRREISNVRTETTQTIQDRDAAHEKFSKSTQQEIHALRDRAIKAELALKQEEERSLNLKQEAVKVADMEKICAGQKEELDNLKKNHEKELRDKDRRRKDDKKASKADIEELKNRIADMELAKKNDKQRIFVLQKRLANMTDLEEANTKLLSKLEKANGKAKSLGDKDVISKRERDEAKEKTGALTKLVRERDAKIKIEMEKVANLETQLGALERENKLRKKQFKSRFKVQEERVQDLEQQLSSLYTAFHMERNERKQEHDTQAVLQMSLDDADARVAHQIHTEEERTIGFRSPGTPGTFDVAPISYQQNGISPEQPFSKQLPDQIVTVVEGYLSKRDNFKGWKKRYCRLTGNLSTGTYTLTFTDGPGGKIKGTVQGIQPGASAVAKRRDHSKYPLAFILYQNPRDQKAPIVTMAADKEDDLNMWFDALQAVTTAKAKILPIETEAVHHQHPVGSRVVIVDLRNCPEFNGCTGMVKTPLKDGKQCVIIEETRQKVKLSPANLEIFSLEGVSPRKQLDFSSHQEQTDREIAMIMQQTLNEN